MILRAVTPVVAFVVALLFGRYWLTTSLPSYDDEGYFLLMIKHYLGGETSLYGGVQPVWSLLYVRPKDYVSIAGATSDA